MGQNYSFGRIYRDRVPYSKWRLFVRGDHVSNFVASFDPSQQLTIYPPASKASREVENLTERKIHMPPFIVSLITSETDLCTY